MIMNLLLRSFQFIRCIRWFSLATDVNNGFDEGIVLYRKHCSVVLIGLNRPEKRNALNTDLVNELENAINKFENDNQASAAVIFGEGGNFCAGYDLQELSDNDQNVPEHFICNATQRLRCSFSSGDGLTYQKCSTMNQPVDKGPYFLRIIVIQKLTERYIKKPLIAAVNGYAVGAGFDLALWCDLRVMETSAIIGCLSRRYGMTMSESGIGRLQEMVGLSSAMDILLTGRPIKCDEAQQLRIANMVTEPGAVLSRALGVAIDLTRFPQAGLQSDRATLYRHTFGRIPFKNRAIHDTDFQKHQVIEDVKRGAKLFSNGVGKHGIHFSCNLWKDV